MGTCVRTRPPTAPMPLPPGLKRSSVTLDWRWSCWGALRRPRGPRWLMGRMPRHISEIFHATDEPICCLMLLGTFSWQLVEAHGQRHTCKLAKLISSTLDYAISAPGNQGAPGQRQACRGPPAHCSTSDPIPDFVLSGAGAQQPGRDPLQPRRAPCWPGQRS